MRFTWFNLMPWPHLPADFRERDRSVRVDIPSSLYDPRKWHFVYHEYMDQLALIDEAGHMLPYEQPAALTTAFTTAIASFPG